MHVEHLLQDETLGLHLLWAEHALLERRISGVTVTDLEEPARFVRPGEVVLSGLVWWTPEGGRDKADRFVAGLRHADAAVLLAGEETHGAVPGELIEACARHGIPLAAVPTDVMFRAVTDTVYLQQWGELSRHHALPESTRARLSRLIAQDAGPDAVVAAAFAHLGRAVVAQVLTPAGRTVAATEGGAGSPRRRPRRCWRTAPAPRSPSTRTPPLRTSAGTCTCPIPVPCRPACCAKSPRSWLAARRRGSAAGPPSTGRRTGWARCSSPPGRSRPGWRRHCGPADCRPRDRTG